jgi:hypothetical protein
LQKLLFSLWAFLVGALIGAVTGFLFALLILPSGEQSLVRASFASLAFGFGFGLHGVYFALSHYRRNRHKDSLRIVSPPKFRR